MPAEAVGSGAHGATAAPGTAAPDNSSLVMVLDSSGSMADDDGTGRTRMETARSAVGTVVDGLPDHYPTGLRVYGAGRTRGCTDTRLDLDAVSTADFSSTAVPQPGAAVDTFDALRTSIAYGAESSCATNTEHSLWYKVPAGWGQQVRYDVEFANEPTVEKASSYSYGATQLFTPARFPVGGGGEFTSTAMYNGRPAAIRMGSVPVAWTNRYEYRSTVQPVHTRGEFYISVTLGARAAEIAENPQVGVVLRVSVLGDERAGPEHGAPVVGKNADNEADKRGKSPSAADSGGRGGAGWTGIAAAAGAGAVVVVIAALVFVRSRRRSATQTTRGSA
ncbi:hypothetical protein OG784_20530 [Streptomyces sp. NBC_01617]|uniref:hypothetical protein n=1 Tax=Streptomyces sp. NBC_01617 TaxID=2975899 RepID=UPI00386817B3|nr:hypothetical protein OG784_20530 [Streptomyces sp. NBC_01617]